MKVFESRLYKISKNWLGGWKLEDKASGALFVPNSQLKTQIGLVWMQVRKTKRGRSLNSHQTEDLMFFSFARAIKDPSSRDGDLWTNLKADDLVDLIIGEANKSVQDPLHTPSWWH